MMLAKDAAITAEAAVGAPAMQGVETELRRTAHRRDLFRSVPEMRIRLLPCRPHGRMPETDGLKAMRTSKAMPEDTAGPLRKPAGPRSPMAPSAPQVSSSSCSVATTGKVTERPWKDDPKRPGTDQSLGQASREGRKEWCVFNLSPTVFSPCRFTAAAQPPRTALHEPKTSIFFAEQRAQAKTMFKPSAFTASRQSSDVRMAGGTDSRTAHAL